MLSCPRVCCFLPPRYVVKGWLTALMQTFEQQPHAGSVGPLFIGDGNMVEEAGAIIWKDAGAGESVGRAWGSWRYKPMLTTCYCVLPTANVARGTPAVNHWFNHMRPVDYISAACVIFTRENFIKVRRVLGCNMCTVAIR